MEKDDFLQKSDAYRTGLIGTHSTNLELFLDCFVNTIEKKLPNMENGSFKTLSPQPLCQKTIHES